MRTTMCSILQVNQSFPTRDRQQCRLLLQIPSRTIATRVFSRGRYGEVIGAALAHADRR